MLARGACIALQDSATVIARRVAVMARSEMQRRPLAHLSRPSVSMRGSSAATPVPRHRSKLLSIVHPWPDLPLVTSPAELHNRVSGNAGTLAVVYALMTGVSGSTLLTVGFSQSLDEAGRSDDGASGARAQASVPLLPGVSLRPTMVALMGASFSCTLCGLMLSAMTLAAIHSTPARAAPLFVRSHALLIAVYGCWPVSRRPFSFRW
eukprot:c9535_g1_i2.p1 GENE.c9535_g1_i2~~c9535_g1_i2.p1  ORF type:complete len:207 (+),score=12.54 c9535_g1_i2:62-682(+)